ncbi:MAG: hypothetical protein U0S36_12535 [Candidatus Nanopelagicales bacterium]
MTLILSALGRGGLLMVGDRRLTTAAPTQGGGSSEPQIFDELANKAGIFYARDGLLTLGYTGLAYIDGCPTDEWIARQLDPQLEADGGWHGLLRTGGTGRRESMGRCLVRLADAMEERLPRQLVRDQDRSLTIDVAGFAWKQRTGRVRPTFWRIEHSGRVGEESICRVKPRYWGWERGDVLFSAIGAGHRTACRTLQEKWLEDAPMSTLAAEELAVTVLRECSDASGGLIGRDCVAVFIVRGGPTTVHYYPDDRGPHGDVDGFDVYSPWFIQSGGGAFAPAVMTGSVPPDMILGLVTVRVERPGTAPPPAGIATAGKQPRRQWP